MGTKTRKGMTKSTRRAQAAKRSGTGTRQVRPGRAIGRKTAGRGGGGRRGAQKASAATTAPVE